MTVCVGRVCDSGVLIRVLCVHGLAFLDNEFAAALTLRPAGRSICSAANIGPVCRNLAFGTVPLAAMQWTICVAMGSGVHWFSVLRKWATRLRA